MLPIRDDAGHHGIDHGTENDRDRLVGDAAHRRLVEPGGDRQDQCRVLGLHLPQDLRDQGTIEIGVLEMVQATSVPST